MREQELTPQRYMNLRRERNWRVAVVDERLRFQRTGRRRYLAVLGYYGERRVKQDFRRLADAQAFARRWLLDHPRGLLADLLQRARDARGLLVAWDEGDADAERVLGDLVQETDFERYGALRGELGMLGWPA